MVKWYENLRVQGTLVQTEDQICFITSYQLEKLVQKCLIKANDIIAKNFQLLQFQPSKRILRDGSNVVIRKIKFLPMCVMSLCSRLMEVKSLMLLHTSLISTLAMLFQASSVCDSVGQYVLGGYYRESLPTTVHYTINTGT